MMTVLQKFIPGVHCMHPAFIVKLSAHAPVSCIPGVMMILCRNKHYNQKFRRERAEKVIKIKLPDYDERRAEEKLSVEEIRSKLKEKGIAPTRGWNEKPMHISCAGDIIEPYVPPEGDGKISIISSSGVKKVYDTIGKKGKSYLALRKIRNIDYEFDVPTVAEKASSIYIEAQNALAAKDEEKLHTLVTEKAFPEMMENVKNKTIIWNYIQSLEIPRVVHIRTTDMGAKGNLFAQVTVRLHSQQTLTVYDRFGRLMYGSEDQVKDVLEYVVFEKHIVSPNPVWRMHGKIIPDWLPPKEAVKKTFFFPDMDKDYPEPPEKSVESTETDSGESNVATQTN